jgi:alpha-galactosidase
VTTGTTPSRSEIGWADDALEMRIELGEDGMARLVHLAAGDLTRGASAATGGDGPPDRGPVATGLPLVDIIVSGTGRAWSGRRYVESVVGGRLRYVGHEERADGPWRELEVGLQDPGTGLRADVIYRVLEGGGVVRSRTRLTNEGAAPVTIESVTSFLGSGLAGPAGGNLDDVDIMWAENDWLAEGRWQRRAFRDALPDLNRDAHGAHWRDRLGFTSLGGWSSGTYLPMGAAVNRRTGHAWAWQIEHNGGWHWQVGEHKGRDAIPAGDGDGPATYLALLGPTDAEHHWRLTLRPAESFESVPVAISFSGGGFEGAVGRLTNYRRAIRRLHADHRLLPVIFNDYMNTLMGDPTPERLAPLITAAARAGAEYFCIDAGWYADIGEAWWDTVGAWKPSLNRFPSGITEVLDRITASGMVPGLWIEPEVVGVRSPVAEQLPAEAFFARQGERVVEQGRYHLDLRHPLAVAHLDQVVDFLVGNLGVGYLKMDYNINVGPGTDTGEVSAGTGMLAHNRAYLDWVDGILDRYPGLTIESCSSGGMRTDYALLSRFQLHSTSDQQDFSRYPPIAAAAPAAVAPEQAAVWAYPQPGWSDDEIAFTLCSALLCRVHLSGHIDEMSEEQQRLVADAIDVYKQIRPDLATALPFWPLGLPGWTDPWVALGMRAAATAYVVVWHRGADPRAQHERGRPAEIVLPLPHGRGEHAVPTVLYPPRGGTGVDWSALRGELTVTLPRTPSSCLVQLALPTRTSGGPG